MHGHTEGYNAFWEGILLSQCPYSSHEDKYDSWREGWQWAKEDAEL